MRCNPLREQGWLPLLAEVLRGTPRLGDALCRGQTRLFDAEDCDPIERDNQLREAVRLCNACPELKPCAEWVAGLPKSRRPSGVVAGTVSGGPS